MTSDDVKQRAVELGFDLCGIAPVDAHPELAFYQQWLARGYAGEMAYLHRTAERRADVRAVMPGAQSVIVLGTVYNVDRPYSTEIASPSTALIARYAWGDDYHDVIQRRMDALVEWMRARSDGQIELRAYVDTGPVQERVYAQYAGLGWIGRNTCVINAELGSWFFLSEIICSLPLEPDRPALDQCGSCRLCLDACPTGALVGSAGARRHTLPVVSDHRGARRDSRSGTRLGWRARLRLRHLSGGVSLEPAEPAVDTKADSAWLPRLAFDRPSLAQLWRTPDPELRASAEEERDDARRASSACVAMSPSARARPGTRRRSRR